MSVSGATWVADIRTRARGVAAELADEGVVDADSASYAGWVLWKGLTLTGESMPKERGLGFQWWHYTTVLALRGDGEIVTFRLRDPAGGRSPDDVDCSVRPAPDDLLSYPDVVRWDGRTQIMDAPARTITDTYRVPAEYADPPGAGIKQALEDARSERRPPEPLGYVPVPPQAKKGFLQRLFGA